MPRVVDGTKPSATSKQYEHEFLTVAEMADILRMHPDSIYSRLWSGEIPYTQLSTRAVRVKRTDFEAWLESKQR